MMITSAACDTSPVERPEGYTTATSDRENDVLHDRGIHESYAQRDMQARGRTELFCNCSCFPNFTFSLPALAPAPSTLI